MSKKKLIAVFLAILLAVIAGHLSGTESALFGVRFYDIYSLIGQLFLNALTLVVVPLVAASIIMGTARMGSERDMESLGIKTFAVFLGTTLIAITIGWILSLVLQPGVLEKHSIVVNSKALEIAQYANGSAFTKIEQILLRLVPSNILLVASQGQMLGLIFFSLLFGFLTSKIEAEPSRVLLGFWKGIFQVMMKMTELVMRAMPIGVFGLVAKVVATTGWEGIVSVGNYFLLMLIGLFLYAVVALSGLLYGYAKINPFKHMRAMGPALLTAFSTSSSAATLPVSLECVEKRSGVSNRIASFMLPLGTSINLAGSSMQVIVAVFYISQVYGVEITLSTQLVIVLMTWLLSIGVAGIPSASLVSVVIVLTAIGFPADGVGLIMAVERLLDMCRTAVNVYSTSCCAVLVAKSEGESLALISTRKS